MRNIPYARQCIEEDDIQAVIEVLRSDWITQGPLVAEFEKTIADYCGARYAVAVSSGTAGLHLACLVMDLKAGDEVITSPLTFVATSNAILYAGARPVFADVDPRTGNLDPAQVKKLIGPRTRGIIPVHFAGLPSDMAEFRALAKRHGLFLIEDACHALGASYQNERIGACRHSALAVFSFHPVKHITTGEGGCITTQSSRLYRRLKALNTHGIYKDEALTRRKGGWFYEMQELGFNYRITDVQCALGFSQMRKLAYFLKRRAEIVRCYNEGLADLQEWVQLPQEKFSDRKHAWHLYVLRMRSGRSPLNRRELYEGLWKKGIRTQVHYIPVYSQPFYKKQVFQNGRYPQCSNAERFYQEAISLPLFPGLKEGEVNKIVRTVRGLFLVKAGP